MEREIKYRINKKSDYLKLKRLLSNHIKTDQLINYYFDTSKKYLVNNKMMFRARKIKSDRSILITFKRGTDIQNGFFVSEEYEDKIDISEFRLIEVGKKNILHLNLMPIKKLIASMKNKKIKDFEIIGNIKVTRSKYFLDEIKAFVVLDRVKINNRIEFYEVEVEIDRIYKENKVKRFLEALFIKNDISFNSSTKTKYEVFIENIQVK